MLSEVGLKEPPPPAIDILAELVGLQAGVGLGDGLGEGLVPGDGLGLGDGLVPGEGLGLGDVPGLGDGLGLGLCARVAVAPTLKKITPMVTINHWIREDFFSRGVLEGAAWWWFRIVVIVLFRFSVVETDTTTRRREGLATKSNAVVTFGFR